MRIALYGGSFDPPHVGHLLTATLILATQPVDAIWYVPAFNHAGGKQLTAFEDRFEMTSILARMTGVRTSVSQAERRLATTLDCPRGFSIDLVRYVISDWPRYKFRFVIGSDLVSQFTTWEGADEIAEHAPLIVIPRAGYTPASPTPGEVTIPDVSSTQVRAAYRARQWRRISQLVPRDVAHYIEAHHLYGCG